VAALASAGAFLCPPFVVQFIGLQHTPMLNPEDFKIKYIESGTVTKVTIPAKKKPAKKK
jgi:hypothetical protein